MPDFATERSAAPTRRAATLFCADVVGYSRLMAEDELATVRALAERRALLANLVVRHEGRVVDAPGDYLLAEFAAAAPAVRCALAAQQQLAVDNAAVPAERRMEYRIGLHAGEVLVEDGRVYGSDLNTAARLEALAEPGGICLSAVLLALVKDEVRLDANDWGEQWLKNLPAPVRVYHVSPAAASPRGPAALPARDLGVSWLGHRPAVAVLPFRNLTGDAGQEYVVDGMAEELIDRLLRWHLFPVIARDSTFEYKGRPVDPRKVSRELGARYLVGGSVRAAGDRLRISARLMDAETGAELWSERFDRGAVDLFDLQDEIGEAVVASIGSEILVEEAQRSVEHPPRSRDTWDLTLRGLWHYRRRTAADNREARARFEEALRLDPRCLLAHYGATMVHFTDLICQWTSDAVSSGAATVRHGEAAVALDSRDALAQLALGLAYIVRRDPVRAVDALGTATTLNPSLAQAYSLRGQFLPILGRADEAIEEIKKAIRISPQDPQTGIFFFGIGVAHFFAARFAEAAAWLDRAAQRMPDEMIIHAFRVPTFGHLGRLDDAAAAALSLYRIQPDFTVEKTNVVLGLTDQHIRDRVYDGFRRAGVVV